MRRLRTFLKRHVLLVGLACVVVPLLSMIGLQYWSLRKLEKTSIVAGNVGMKNYLYGVQGEIRYFYKTSGEQTLSVPPYSVKGDSLRQIKQHFPICKVEGARLLFITSLGAGGATETLYFNPQDSSQRIAEVSQVEERAVQFVNGQMRLLSDQATTTQQTMAFVEDHDPNNLILFKAITEGSKIVGVAGMILDPAYFRDVLLPNKLKEMLPKYFPDGTDENVVITAYDPAHNLVFRSQAAGGRDDEIKVMLPYFYEYTVSVRSRHMTPEQWAHANFNYSLSLLLVMTAMLTGGIVLALRVASREMRLSQMKADFVSNVSHELRTPLASIRVFGEFLKLGRVGEQAKIREYGEHIETESRRLTQLINNILDFSKIESGRKTYNFERVQVEDIVAETLKTCEVRLKQSGFAIVFQPGPRALPPAIVDREALAQALMNLLDNAVKYSEKAEKKEIVVRVGESAGLIRISVKDHGVGIAPAEQKKIFDKFYRVSTGLVHDVKGSGLGLSLVKHIVEAHRGAVSVESEPGYGSTFVISLPTANGHTDHAETPRATPLISGDAPHDLAFKH